MGAANAKEKSAQSVQDVCIDLPGETVQCWRSSDNIKVILRKHRDVIFEIKINEKAKYTVESTGSDFYNANEKKLITGKERAQIVFNDGERLHLWVARDFKGALLLKSAGKLMLRLEPDKFDGHKYDDLPKTKPLPIIIALTPFSNSSKTLASGAVGKSTFASEVTPTNARPVAANIDEDHAIVCVVDGDLKGMPEKIRVTLKNVKDKAQLIDLNTEDIVTKNWLLTQLAGTAAYARDNWEWLRASLDGRRHDGFKLVKAKIHYIKGKPRYFFSGYSKHNTVFGPGGFGPGHDRIVSIFGGAGNASSMAGATFKGVAGTFKGNALVSFIFGSALAVAEWKEDVSKDGYDLTASLIMSVVKAIVSAALTVLIVTGLVLFIMFFMGGAMSVIAIGAVTVGVGTVVGFGVDALDKKLGKIIGGESNKDGLSGVLAEHMRQSVHYHWRYLKKKFLWDYEGVPQ